MVQCNGNAELTLALILSHTSPCVSHVPVLHNWVSGVDLWNLGVEYLYVVQYYCYDMDGFVGRLRDVHCADRATVLVSPFRGCSIIHQNTCISLNDKLVSTSSRFILFHPLYFSYTHTSNKLVYKKVKEKGYFDVWKYKAAAICCSFLQTRRYIKGYKEETHNAHHVIITWCKFVKVVVDGFQHRICVWKLCWKPAEGGLERVRSMCIYNKLKLY